MILIDGKKAAAELREELKQEVLQLKAKHNKVPGLTVILIGDMAPSQIYVRNKEKSANEVGLKSEVIRYPDSVEEKTVLEKIEEFDPLTGEKTNDYSAIKIYANSHYITPKPTMEQAIRQIKSELAETLKNTVQTINY